MKRCTSCGVEKPLEDFHVQYNAKDGRQFKCKVCCREWHQKYNSRPDVKENKKPRINAYNKQYRAENQQKAKDDYLKWRKTSPVHALGKSLRRALVRKMVGTPVTLKELFKIWSDQEGKCALSGVDMTWGLGAYYPTSLSIDRIDSKEGYTKDNVRLLCYAVNAMKGVWGDDHVLELARAIVDKADAKAVSDGFGKLWHDPWWLRQTPLEAALCA